MSIGEAGGGVGNPTSLPQLFDILVLSLYLYQRV